MTTATQEKKQELAVYDVNDAQISEMSEKFMPLKVKGPEDTEGLRKITQYRIEAKGIRVKIEHNRKSNNEKANKFVKDNNAEAKRLTALVVPIEDHLIEQENIVKKEKQRLKDIEQEKIQKVHELRIKKIIDAGATYNGFEYVYGDNSIDDTRIRLMDDSMFEMQIEKISLWKEKENLRIAEVDRVAREFKEQQDKIAKENETKAVELKAKEDEQSEKEAKLKAQQDEIDEKNRKFEEEKRINEAREAEKKAAEEKASEDKKKHEAEIEAATLKSIEDEKRHKIEVEEAKKKATAEAKAEADKKEKDRIDAEKKAKDAADRRDRLAPDKEKLYKYAKELFDVLLPDLKNEESKKFFEPIHTEIVKAIHLIQERSGLKK